MVASSACGYIRRFFDTLRQKQRDEAKKVPSVLTEEFPIFCLPWNAIIASSAAEIVRG
jgi:hypothetical protein